MAKRNNGDDDTQRDGDRYDGEGMRITRRRALQGGVGAVGAAAIGCSSEVEQGPAPTPTATSGSGGAGGMGGTSSTSSTSSQGGSGGGAGGQGGQGGQDAPSCNDDGGLSASELLAPIDTIVVLMMENRSFDHYLGGSLGVVEGRMDIEGLIGTETNPDGNNASVAVYNMMNLVPASPPHSWGPVHNQWNGGLNDQFVNEANGDPEVMGYYVRSQVPIHHAIADAHVVCNHYYCSVLGPTWPNRFFLHGASSNGMQSNQPVLGFNSIWGPLKNAGATVKNYHHGVPWCAGGYAKLNDLALFSQFKSDAQAGTLPNFSIIDPLFFGAMANDDHPSNGDIPLAQALISDVYSTLAASPQWNRCLLLVTYDEHGGFYDHVAPPTTADERTDFQQMGFRVPALVAGPYVRRTCAVNTVFDHASVAATCSTKWGISPLNQRHGAANDLSSCIDPYYVRNDLPQAPAQLPQLAMSMAALKNKKVQHEQHPELIDSIKQQGIYKTLMKQHDPERAFQLHLEDQIRRGLVRLTS